MEVRRQEVGQEGSKRRFCKKYLVDVQGEALQGPPGEEAALDAELRLQFRK